RAESLHRLRHVRRGVPGEPPERRPDAARDGSAGAGVVHRARGVREERSDVSIGIEKLAPELVPQDAPQGNGHSPTANGGFVHTLADWEDELTLLVDPDSPRIEDRPRKRRLLSFLLERAGIDKTEFWRMGRAQRGRTFLARYSRVSREIPQLEITSFDVDKAIKERFRKEPLTIGAAWHYGFWRSYFSHAAITHPANDGLREEFSTAWDIVRKQPAVLFRTG